MQSKESDKATKSQADKFREAARELETDDSEERFREMVKKIAPKPKDEKDQGTKSRS